MHAIALLALVPFLLLAVAVLRPGRLVQSLLTVPLGLMLAVGIAGFMPLLAYEGGQAAMLDAVGLVLLPFICILLLWRRPRTAPMQMAPTHDRCTFPHCLCHNRAGCVVARQARIEPRFRVN